MSEWPTSEQKEKEFKLECRALTEEEERDNIFDTLGILQDLKMRAIYYPNRAKLPKQLQEMKEEDLFGMDEFQARKVIDGMDLEYDKAEYAKAIEDIKAQFESFMKIAEVFKKWNAAWGFKLFYDIKILVKKYGLKTCDGRTGTITLLTKMENVLNSMIHEVVHIGTDDLVHEKGLEHGQREHLVDCILLNVLKLPGYRFRGTGEGHSDMDEFITLEAMENLPAAIEKYLEAKK